MPQKKEASLKHTALLRCLFRPRVRQIPGASDRPRDCEAVVHYIPDETHQIAFVVPSTNAPLALRWLFLMYDACAHGGHFVVASQAQSVLAISLT